MTLFKELPIGQRFRLENSSGHEWQRVENVCTHAGWIQHNVSRISDGKMDKIGHSAKVLLPPYGDLTKADRQKKRRAQVKEVITAKNWSSTEEMLTAMVDGRVEVPKKPA